MATKNIAKGSEIYVAYGKVYWSEPRRYNKLPAVDQTFVDEIV
jgi:hypothetical protein